MERQLLCGPLQLCRHLLAGFREVHDCGKGDSVTDVLDEALEFLERKGRSD